MTCERVSLQGGGTAIVCTGRRSQRCKCGKSATLLCDWKVPRKKSGTCDAPICALCTTKPAPDKDLCPKHGDEFEKWKASR